MYFCALNIDQKQNMTLLFEICKKIGGNIGGYVQIGWTISGRCVVTAFLSNVIWSFLCTILQYFLFIYVNFIYF